MIHTPPFRARLELEEIHTLSGTEKSTQETKSKIVKHPYQLAALPSPMHLFSVEVVIIFALDILVKDTDSGTCLTAPNYADTVIPQSRANLVVRESSKNQDLICNLQSHTITLGMQ